MAGVTIRTDTPVEVLETGPEKLLQTPYGLVQCEALVIATGGLSIPKMGATGFGFELARRLDIPVVDTRAGLVPLVIDDHKLKPLAELSGISLDTNTATQRCEFRENILFTHRGLSGPAILQVSSYWQPGETLQIDLFPGVDFTSHLTAMRREKPKAMLKSILSEKLTKRVAQLWCEQWIEDKPLAQLSDDDIKKVVAQCQPWTVKPSGTEGYRTAEVTLGVLIPMLYPRKPWNARIIRVCISLAKWWMSLDIWEDITSNGPGLLVMLPGSLCNPLFRHYKAGLCGKRRYLTSALHLLKKNFNAPPVTTPYHHWL